MQEQDFRELSEYFALRMTEVGFPDLREVIFEEARLARESDEQSSISQFIDLLDAFESQVALRDQATIQAVVRRLNETVDDGRVDGIELVITGGDRDLFREESVDLVEIAVPMAELRREISDLRADVLESRG